MLENLTPSSIFAYGAVLKEHTDIGSPASKYIHFVAVRGYIADWAIYSVPSYLSQDDADDWSIQRIAQFGDKIHSEELVRELVSVSDDVMKRYRH